MRTHWTGRVTVSLIVAVSVTLLWPTEARSEEQPEGALPIVVGSRVRLAATAVQGAIQGTVMEMDDKSLLLGTDDHRPLRVSRKAITQLEVSTGRRGRALKGMAIGGAIGAAVFAAVPRDEYCIDLGPGDSCPSKAGIIGTGILGGAFWGALIGHFVKTDRWSSVPLEGVHVSLTPVRARGATGLSLFVGW